LGAAWDFPVLYEGFNCALFEPDQFLAERNERDPSLIYEFPQFSAGDAKPFGYIVNF
jgi:hypothetical protein